MTYIKLPKLEIAHSCVFINMYIIRIMDNEIIIHRIIVYLIILPLLGISYHITLKCLSIGTPKTINFSFVPNG